MGLRKSPHESLTDKMIPVSRENKVYLGALTEIYAHDDVIYQIHYFILQFLLITDIKCKILEESAFHCTHHCTVVIFENRLRWDRSNNRNQRDGIGPPLCTPLSPPDLRKSLFQYIDLSCGVVVCRCGYFVTTVQEIMRSADGISPRRLTARGRWWRIGEGFATDLTWPERTA